MAIARFGTGKLIATPAAMDALTKAGESHFTFLSRHAKGDWGEVSEGDKQANAEAIDNCDRILSAYTLKDGSKIWIITDADRSATTILLPEEY